MRASATVAAVAHAHRLAVALRAEAGLADPALAEHRHVDHAEFDAAAAHQRDQRAPERRAGDEAARAVDRVEHPDALGVQRARGRAPRRRCRRPAARRRGCRASPSSAARSACVTGLSSALAMMSSGVRKRRSECAAAASASAWATRRSSLGEKLELMGRGLDPSTGDARAWAASQRVAAVALAKADRIPARADREADHLEQFAHLVLVDQPLRHRALGAARPLHHRQQAAVEQKARLAGVAQHSQPGVLAGQRDAGEIDVRGDVLGARRRPADRRRPGGRGGTSPCPCGAAGGSTRPRESRSR